MSGMVTADSTKAGVGPSNIIDSTMLIRRIIVAGLFRITLAEAMATSIIEAFPSMTYAETTLGQIDLLPANLGTLPT
ncbi:hypothetical protein H8B02_18685 [Bradyrhizobium sp. Pear77]|uniref:hypothetical protein n=1 Tax=Bradyrhizobium altum TaxID=1571202 RepID=UPI001E63F60D|nr:hypothetical protein [Bradyrhizobium altum]MCC8955386.1 hypothetical protein [Bradyrhizobium altum]